MRAPGFWQQRDPGLTARLAMALLTPAAAVYGGVTARRMARPGTRVGAPVICVGNFVAGGAGKTPAAISLVAHLARRGLRPAFVSRGYGGALSRQGAVTQIDPAVHDARLAGDEPLLLAAAAPTFVARDRLAGARAAVGAGADVIILDDGLQNPALHKDLALAVVDGAVGVGNGRVLPAGPLRAPLSAQWPAVHAVVVIGAGDAGQAIAREAQARGKPALRASLRPDAAVAARLTGRRVLALAGIGRPEKFVATLREIGAEVVDLAAFGDHHPYRPADLAPLAARAAREGLTLVTTAKDAARMAGDASLAPVLAQMTVLPVTLTFADDGALDALLAKVLAR